MAIIPRTTTNETSQPENYTCHHHCHHSHPEPLALSRTPTPLATEQSNAPTTTYRMVPHAPWTSCHPLDSHPSSTLHLHQQQTIPPPMDHTSHLTATQHLMGHVDPLQRIQTRAEWPRRHRTTQTTNSQNRTRIQNQHDNLTTPRPSLALQAYRCNPQPRHRNPTTMAPVNRNHKRPIPTPTIRGPELSPTTNLTPKLAYQQPTTQPLIYVFLAFSKIQLQADHFRCIKSSPGAVVLKLLINCVKC